ncbi:MAG: PQQ-like beta-propeller repeat protein [Planctomycetia bacterium]|nr:PQQ-like beta-propeller repeat protein [Planctomycetia bacterium]
MRYKTLFLLILGLGLSFLLSGADWPNWKGPNRDNISPETGLLEEWPDEGPKVLQISSGLGEGYSNLCIYGNRIFTLGDFADITCLVALDRESGKVLGKAQIAPGGAIGGHIGPKSTPSTDGENVYGLTQRGILFCADFEFGKIKWTKDLVNDFGGGMMNPRMNWGFAESVLLDGEKVVCTPGGKKGSVIAFNKKTGKLIWRSTQIKDDATYASITPVEIEGKRQYLVMMSDHIAGIDPENGKVLWKVAFPGRVAACTDPVYANGSLFATCAYGVGGFGYQIATRRGKTIFEENYTMKKVDNKHHGLICLDGKVYSTSSSGALYCFDIATGKILWENRRFRSVSAISYADGKLYLRGESSGEIVLVEANPEKYIEKGRFTQQDRSDKNAWTYPIILDGRMYVRDQDKLFQYDLKK